MEKHNSSPLTIFNLGQHKASAPAQAAVQEGNRPICWRNRAPAGSPEKEESDGRQPGCTFLYTNTWLGFFIFITINSFHLHIIFIPAAIHYDIISNINIKLIKGLFGVHCCSLDQII